MENNTPEADTHTTHEPLLPRPALQRDVITLAICLLSFMVDWLEIPQFQSVISDQTEQDLLPIVMTESRAGMSHVPTACPQRLS